ncbi:hypothetical protein JI58_05205 [Marinosulfonomonas sp. PRT-SC04]|nr:hypothetical protein JI58_05205 [Marinosulfonomonas sp. PRT-SC04]
MLQRGSRLAQPILWLVKSNNNKLWILNMASLKPCKTCKNEVATSARICPHCGQKLKSGFFVKAIKGVGTVFFLLVLVGLLMPEPDQTKTKVNIAMPDNGSLEEQQDVPAKNPRPTEQKAFLLAIVNARTEASSALNDMQKGAALASRSKLICSILPSGKRVVDWYGTIYSINANSEGKGVLVVEIEDDSWVSTWNNALSDIGTNSLIEPNTNLFRDVSALSAGDTIVFSGEFFTDRVGCVSTHNLMLSSKINRPEFVFKFKSVRLAD